MFPATQDATALAIAAATPEEEGRLAEAARLHRQALREFEQCYGTNHPRFGVFAAEDIPSGLPGARRRGL